MFFCNSYLRTSPIMAIVVSRNRITVLLCINNSRGCLLLACSPHACEEEMASFSPEVPAEQRYWDAWAGIRAQLGNSHELF